MRWSQKLAAEGRNIEEVVCAIRRKDSLTVAEAEILLDLPVNGGYRFVRTLWSTFSVRYGARGWRIHRPSLEALPGETEGVAQAMANGYVRVPRIMIAKLEKEIGALKGRVGELERKLRLKDAIIGKLIEGIEGAEIADLVSAKEAG